MLASGYQARDADELHDLLLRLGDLDETEIGSRCETQPQAWLTLLDRQRRAVKLRVGGSSRWIAASDAGLYRDALGAMPPANLPADMLAHVPGALDALVTRFARRRGPFLTSQLETRYGSSSGQAESVLNLARVNGRLIQGHIRPSAPAAQWCDAEVLRRLKRETLAHLRRQVAPVEMAALADYLPRWHGIGSKVSTPDRLLDVLEQLQGLPLPWTTWHEEVLPSRVRGFTVDALEQLCAMGQVVWFGAGAQGPRDARVVFHLRGGETPILWPDRLPETHEWTEPASGAVINNLRTHGARFQTELELAMGEHTQFDAQAVSDALRELMWAGVITNDTLAPLRYLNVPARRRYQGRNLRGGRRAPVTGGRWSAVPEESADLTRATLARTETLLGRYGIVSREMALADGVRSGFTGIYKVLRQMEESGRVRRGYFVEGLSGAQFSLPGAVDLLRRAERGSAADAAITALPALAVCLT
jgi:ATP-dependent helicase Lhr and Lhr-like helicase